MDISILLLVGVFDMSAVLSIGTSEFASGKYAAAEPAGMSYGMALKPSAWRNSSFQ